MWNKIKNWLGRLDSDTGMPHPEKKVWDNPKVYDFLKKYPHMTSMKNFRVAELYDEIHMNRARIIELENKLSEAGE